MGLLSCLDGGNSMLLNTFHGEMEELITNEVA